MHAAALLAFSILLASGPPEEAQDAVKRLYAQYDYQRQLFPQFVPPRPPDDGAAKPGGGTSGGPEEPTDPGAEPPPGPAEAPDGDERHPEGNTWSRQAWREDLKRQVEQHRGLPDERGDRPRREREVSVRYSGGLGTLLEVLLWVVLAVAAVTVIAALVRSRGAREEKLEATVQKGAAVPRAALDAPRSEAEALAADGHYDEAVHLLLLKTIEALVRSRPGGLPEAWTSREIQRAMPMPDSARAPFGALVDAVERSLFGGRSVDEADWRECLERFQDFESAYRATTPRTTAPRTTAPRRTTPRAGRA